MQVGSVQGGTAQTSGTYDRLAKADFLGLLVAQLKYQDPLNPVDNNDFTMQMAQLQLLEQSQQANETLLALTYLSQLSQATSLIGRTVTATPAGRESISGTVSEVRVTDGVAELVIGDKTVGLHEVITVS